MGTAIRLFLFSCFTLGLMGCAALKSTNKGLFIRSYKRLVFHYSLQEITDNKLGQILREKGGHISFMADAEELGPAFNDSAAATAKRFVAQIEPLMPDAQEGGDFYQQKALVAECLNFYESRKLDSIARKMYRHTRERNQ